jgi:hypothetical protein
MAPLNSLFKTMPTPDASQYTQFKRYASISGDAVGSVGSKISPFNTFYSIPLLSASSQALFLPSANKKTKFPSSVYTSSLTLNNPITNPIVPTGDYHLFTFTPSQSGWYRIILDQFGGGGPYSNDMDLAVGYGNTPMDIPAIVYYDFSNPGYNTPPDPPIKVFSFSGGPDDYITDYFSAGCTYQVLVIGYNGDYGGTYTLTVLDNRVREGLNNGIVSSFYYTGSYQLYRFIPTQSGSYDFVLDFDSGGNDADLFISTANTELDIQGCISFDGETGPQPDSLLAYGTSGSTENVQATLTAGSTYEVVVYEYYTGHFFDMYNLSITKTPVPTTITVDLTGITFDGTGNSGHNFYGVFTFSPTNSITVSFTNAPTSINQVTHIQFQGPDGTVSPSDAFTVANPTLTPEVSSQDVGGNVYLYTNGSFPLTASSIITLTTANTITGVTFSIN